MSVWKLEKPPLRRFWSKVAVKVGQVNESYEPCGSQFCAGCQAGGHCWQRWPCWEWKEKAHCGRRGELRGKFRMDGRRPSTHRAAWELSTRTCVLPWIGVNHHCDNTLCCNPRHLFLGPQSDNIKDMDAKGRRRSFTGPNLTKRSLTPEQEIAIKQRYAEKGVRYIAKGPKSKTPGRVTMQQLADEYGTNLATVSRTINGVIRHKGSEG